MTGRTLWYFVTLGGLCALLGFLATLTKEKGLLVAMEAAYILLVASFLAAGCRRTGKLLSGKSDTTRV